MSTLLYVLIDMTARDSNELVPGKGRGRPTSRFAQRVAEQEGSRESSLVEPRTRDQKVASSILGRSDGRGELISVLTYSVSVLPPQAHFHIGGAASVGNMNA